MQSTSFLQRALSKWYIGAAIIGVGAVLLVGLQFPVILERKSGKASEEQLTLTVIEYCVLAARHYEAKNGRLPRDTSALIASGLVKKPLLVDAWGNEVRIEWTMTAVMVNSCGPDGRFKTDDDLWRWLRDSSYSATVEGVMNLIQSGKPYDHEVERKKIEKAFQNTYRDVYGKTYEGTSWIETEGGQVFYIWGTQRGANVKEENGGTTGGGPRGRTRQDGLE